MIATCSENYEVILPTEKRIASVVEVKEITGNETFVLARNIEQAYRNVQLLNKTGDASDPIFEDSPKAAHEYPCGLKKGDIIDFGVDRNPRLPSHAFVSDWTQSKKPSTEQVSCATDDEDNPLVVHVSHVHKAARNGRELQKCNNLHNIVFFDPDTAGSKPQ
jgi:hypothetical protein